MKRHFIYLLCLLAVCSCKKHIVLHSFDHAIETSLKNKENALIAVGDISIIKGISALRLSDEFKDYEIYACDITLPENIHANYIYDFEQFPSFMIVNSDSGIVDIASAQELATWQYITQKRHRHSCESYTLYKFYKAIKNSSYEEMRCYIDTIRTFSDNFYKNYLGFKASLMLNDDMQDFFFDNAIKSYIEKPDPRYSLIFSELLESRNSNCAEILIKEDIDIGEIPRNETKEYKLPYINVGKEPLYFFNVTVSCNCVNVIWERVTDPGMTNEMTISISANNNIGNFERSIFVTTNTLEGGVLINLHGKII